MGIEAAVFCLDVLISTLFTWLAMSLRQHKPEWPTLVSIIFITSAVALLPQVGFVLSLVVFLILLVALAHMEAAEALWVVLIAKMLYLAIVFCLASLGDWPLIQ